MRRLLLFLASSAICFGQADTQLLEIIQKIGSSPEALQKFNELALNMQLMQDAVAGLQICLLCNIVGILLLSIRLRLLGAIVALVGFCILGVQTVNFPVYFILASLGVIVSLGIIFFGLFSYFKK